MLYAPRSNSLRPIPAKMFSSITLGFSSSREPELAGGGLLKLSLLFPRKTQLSKEIGTGVSKSSGTSSVMP